VVHGPPGRFTAGRAVDVLLRERPWTAHQIYVCGGPGMVATTRELLVGSGLPEGQIHHETFGYRVAVPEPTVSHPPLGGLHVARGVNR
jgi:ferredoxin-NADP reductase